MSKRRRRKWSIDYKKPESQAVIADYAEVARDLAETDAACLAAYLEEEIPIPELAPKKSPRKRVH